MTLWTSARRSWGYALRQRLAALALAAGFVAGPLSTADAAGLKAGDSFPDLAAFALEGKLPQTLKDKVVMVDFWASWCDPCKEPLPALEDLHQRYGPKGLVIIAVNVDENRADMEAFLKKHAGTFVVVRDAAQKLVSKTEILTMPSSFLIDRQGKVRFLHSGFRGKETKKQYEQENFAVPPEHHIYFDRLKFETAEGLVLTPAKIDDPIVSMDKVSGREKKMYDRAFAAELKLDALPANLVVKFQGCSNSACYFPEKRSFKVTSSNVVARTDAPAPADAGTCPTALAAQDWRADLAAFTAVARETGYLKSSHFLAFLDRAQSGHGLDDEPLARYKRLGLAATLILIVIGGADLNLTPCVLPLIPINLAIIGAGNRARSRRSSFFHGAVYGAGMALAYGAPGLVVVLTGSKFGALNSSVWFNAAIALVFGVMALAMFDFINIDFSRFQRGAGTSRAGHKSRLVMAFSLGAVAALLAGACVAPVVISVLLLSTHLYAQGMIAGLLLPFLLGLGMALPWPFAGAGMSFLPKPGQWMKRIKYVFGVLILVFACYYGHLAYNLFQSQRRTTALASRPAGAGGDDSITANAVLSKALRQARQEGRPVFIDFTASWGKNCLAMEETVFNQANVQKRLKDFFVVKYQAERPNESPAREVLDRFGVLGLPTFVVLEPNK